MKTCLYHIFACGNLQSSGLAYTSIQSAYDKNTSTAALFYLFYSFKNVFPFPLFVEIKRVVSSLFLSNPPTFLHISYTPLTSNLFTLINFIATL